MDKQIKPPKAATVVYIVMLIVLTAAIMFIMPLMMPNGTLNDVSGYTVRGVDVSNHQGTIDWQALAEQDIQFAFIKATEGGDFVDKRFAYNLENAFATELRLGAYHYFTLTSGGDAQAENFIKTVPIFAEMLPPVVDFEVYGGESQIGAVQAALSVLLNKLERHYGVRPVIYATERAYKRYIAGAFDGYDIWIRNVWFKPGVPKDGGWTFWQYSSRAKLNGYWGGDDKIDLNVFNGTRAEFEQYGR